MSTHQTPQQKKERLFRFKQFVVKHERSGMKVGTDGVLLGAWVNIANAQQILDVGTGAGLIALMLAQRTPSSSHIDAIEIDAIAAEEAFENIKASPWPQKVTLITGAAQNFFPSKNYDLIVSNPPYFQDSYKPPQPQRETARHTESLRFEELLQAAQRLLLPDGRLNVILPLTEGEHFETLAHQFHFYCCRKWTFRTRHHKPIERLLLEFSRVGSAVETGEILLYEQGDEWAPSYVKLTRDFYLKL